MCCLILVWSCQSETATTSTTTGKATETTETPVPQGSIPDSASIDANWVRTLQGNWVLDNDKKLSIQIVGNVYTDYAEGISKGTFQVEYSNGCQKCKSEANLGKNKCLVIFNDDKINDSTCLLLSQLNSKKLSIINTKHPDIVYSYTRK